MSEYELNKNYCIEASAGTGKTYNIIEIVKELTRGGIKINEILIVTYTDKAVEELKYRVKKDVKGVDINQSEIYTIHSFCQKAIRDYCVSCDKPINLDVIDENEVKDYVERYIRDEKIFNDIMMFKKTNSDFSPEKLKNYLISTVKKYYLDRNGNEDKKIVSIENSVYDDLVNAKNFNDLIITSPKLYDLVNDLSSSKNPSALELQKAVINNFNPLDSDFFKWNLTRVNFNEKKYPVEREIFEELIAIKEGAKSYVYEYLVKKHIKDLYLKWLDYKTVKQVQSFNDMIRFVREEVNSNGPLVQKLKAKYKYAIIDEFQDTNGLQWDIFKGLFLNDDHNIIVVGDKKQSIYSFQGADVFVFRKAIDSIEAIGGIKKTLKDNYRSSDAMIKATNKLFKSNSFMDDDFTDSYYPPYKDKAKEKIAKLHGKDFKPIWIVDNKENGGTLLNENQYAKVVSSTIIDLVKNDNSGKTNLQIGDGTGKLHNITFSDITILSRARSEVSAIKYELKRIGIPFICYKDKSLFSGRECVHWSALLCAINAPDFTGSNRKLFKRALFTIFFGRSLKELSDDKYDRDDLDEVELIKKWKRIANTGRFEDLIDSIITDSNIESKMASLNNIQSLAIYKQIGDFLIEYLSDNHSLSEAITKLDNLHSLSFDDDEQDINLVSRSTNFDCVQIMTIHASKGLEFPVVIFAGNYKDPFTPPGECAYLRHNDNGNGQVITYKEDERSAKEGASEWKRLFYVAFTRPRYLLILPNYNTVREKHYNFLYPIMKSFMENNEDSYELIDYKKFRYNPNLLSIEVKKVLNDESSKEVDFSREEQDEVIKELIKDKKNKLIYKHSYSSLSHNNEVLELDEDDKEGMEVIQDLSLFDTCGTSVEGNLDKNVKEVVFPFNFPAGASVGTALHEIFELLDYSSYSDSDLENIMTKAFINAGLKLDDSWIKPIKEMVGNVLNASLPEIKGGKKTNESFKLSSVTLDNKKAEAEFNFNLSGGILHNYANGFVDLLIKRGDYYSILDWKSDKNNDEDLLSYSSFDELKQHTNNRYSIQRVLYSYCLVKWLHSFYQDKSLEEVFNEHFGGVYYVYIRGCNENTANGIYAKTWSSWGELEKSFNHIIESKVRVNL